MAVYKKLSEGEVILLRILKNPVLFSEFIHRLEGDGKEKDIVLDIYQREFLADTNSFISIRAGRAVGKTFSLVHLLLWVLTINMYMGEYIIYIVPNRAQLEPVWEGLKSYFKLNPLVKNLVNYRNGINNSLYRIVTKNGATLLCRIAGTSGGGENVIGLHTPFVVLDECVVGTQRIAGKNTNKRISELKVGDTVLSWDGKNIVEDRVSSVRKLERKQDVLEIQFEDSFIRVGENHRVFVNGEYIKAKDITKGDTLSYFENTGKKHWSEEEVVYVKDQIQTSKKVREIAQELKRTPSAIFKKLHSLGLERKEVLDSRPLSETEYQIILGSFLGEGSAEIEVTRARYRTNHSLKQKQYVDWLWKKLGGLVNTKPVISRNGWWGTWNYTFHTLGHPEILKISRELYINNKKTVTRGYLNKLSALGLAVWWMDNGSESGVLSTHSFSKSENQIILNYLKEVWNIDAYICKDKRKDLYFLCIRYDSLKAFRNIIKEYIPKCMQYKVGNRGYKNQLPDIAVVPFGEDATTLEEKIVTGIRKVNTRAKYLYDITVENNKNFFVGGILTKNSGYFPFGTWLELQAIINDFQSGFKLYVSGVPTGVRERNVCYIADKEMPSFSRHRVSAYENPRFTAETERRAIERYGGKNTPEFAHFVLGKHGSPLHAIFDRHLMKIESYPVYKLDIDGLKEGKDFSSYLPKINVLPALPRNNGVFFGIDLGYTEPTAIYVFFIDKKGKFRIHAKIRLTKVPYPVQKLFIDRLDTIYSPSFLAIDAGHAGMSVTQDLMQDKQYSPKQFNERIIPIEFNSSITVGVGDDGKEIKTRTKPLSVSILQEKSNSHQIIYSSTDMEIIGELERMTYTKNPSTGTIAYKTLTPGGGKKGADHFTSALLCGMLGYYLVNEGLDYREQKGELLGVSWL